jgi:hypothetical protein
MVSFCDIMLRKRTHIELQDDEDDEDSDDEGGDDTMKKRNDAPHVIKNDTEFGWPLIPKRGDMTLDQLKHITQSTITLYKGHLTLTSDPSEGAGPCEPNIIMRAIKGPGPL